MEVLSYLIQVINKARKILIKKIKLKNSTNKYLTIKTIKELNKIRKILNNYSFKLKVVY